MVVIIMVRVTIIIIIVQTRNGAVGTLVARLRLRRVVTLPSREQSQCER